MISMRKKVYINLAMSWMDYKQAYSLVTHKYMDNICMYLGSELDTENFQADIVFHLSYLCCAWFSCR